MSNIGIAANLFQPSGKCLKCRHWNPATKVFMGNGTDGNGVYSINYDNLLDAAAIYFTRFERYIVHHILLSNHVLTRHVVFLLYWSRYGGNEVENG